MKLNLFALVVFTLFLSNKCQSQSKKSIKDALVKMSYNDIDKAIIYYKKLKKEHKESYNFNDENELNSLGYQLINDNRVKEAVKIFKLLVEEFPNSFNPYDSLAEAYLLEGNTKFALINYQKSLILNPNNENARNTIASINFKNRNRNKFYKVYSKQQYLDDIDEMVKTLTEMNPHPYKYMSKEDFWSVVEEKKSLITENTTYGEFIWHCSQLVANINCGHSAIPMYFEQEREMLPNNLRFPMELLNINERLYVANALINSDKIEKGTEIFSINGKSSSEIIADINKHIATQGKVGNVAKRHLFNWQSTAMIPYSMGFPKNYKILIRGKKEPIALKMLDTYQLKLKSLNTCKNTFCLNFIDKNKTAVLTINHWDFYGNRFSILQKFIDDSFQEINKKKPQNLIIDVRGNGGGNSWGASHLLQYLAKKPFTYFKEAPTNSRKLKPLNPFKNTYKGNIYFLADGRSGSTTGQLLALAKHHNIGTIIGEESNGGIVYTGGQKMHYLSNTEVFYMVGRVNHITNASSISQERGVFPHHHIVQTIEDYLNNIDTVMEYTLKLIKQHKE